MKWLLKEILWWGLCTFSFGVSLATIIYIGIDLTAVIGLVLSILGTIIMAHRLWKYFKDQPYDDFLNDDNPNQ